VVAAYGLILPPAILAAPTHGCLNVHGSLLPRWRGAAPVQRAILAGDDATGVAIMQMEKGLDTGPMRLVRSTPVDGKTAGELTDELATLGAAMMVEVLAYLPAFPPIAQPKDGVTYAAKIDKAESRIDWTQDATQVERQIRAFNPAPGAWFEWAGERFRVHAADVVPGRDALPGIVLDDALTIACAGNTAIRPISVQRAGRGVMTTSELLRGFPIPAGTVIP
jgi:methionyl-tRNA formyltransferase